MNLLNFTIGTIIASFTTLCAVRLPRHESIIAPRSHCDHCGRSLSWWQLIPIIGYLMQLGQCYHCHQSINPLWTLNELAFGWLFMKCTVFSPMVATGYRLIFITLILIATTDAVYTFIYPAYFFGLLPLWWLLPHPSLLHPSYWATTCLMICGLWILYHQQGLGIADIEFIFILFLLFKFDVVNIIVLMSSFGAICYALLTRQRAKFAFLPFLCLSLGFYLSWRLGWVILLPQFYKY